VIDRHNRSLNGERLSNKKEIEMNEMICYGMLKPQWQKHVLRYWAGVEGEKGENAQAWFDNDLDDAEREGCLAGLITIPYDEHGNPTREESKADRYRPIPAFGMKWEEVLA
jgi:hypothetical protein